MLWLEISVRHNYEVATVLEGWLMPARLNDVFWNRLRSPIYHSCESVGHVLFCKLLIFLALKTSISSGTNRWRFKWHTYK